MTTYLCSFSALDKSTWRNYAELKTAVLLAGKFSVFDVTDANARLFDRLGEDGTIVVDPIALGYPWVKVTQR